MQHETATHARTHAPLSPSWISAGKLQPRRRLVTAPMTRARTTPSGDPSATALTTATLQSVIDSFIAASPVTPDAARSTLMPTSRLFNSGGGPGHVTHTRYESRAHRETQQLLHASTARRLRHSTRYTTTQGQLRNATSCPQAAKRWFGAALGQWGHGRKPLHTFISDYGH